MKFAYAVTSAQGWARLHNASDANAIAYATATHNPSQQVRILILPKYLDDDYLDRPTAEVLKLAAVTITADECPTVGRVNAKRRQIESELRARFTRGQLTYIAEGAA